VEDSAGDALAGELEIAVRAYAVRDELLVGDARSPSSRRGGGGRRVPEQFLIFDTETTTDATQRLLFGCWRYCRSHEDPDDGLVLECVQEGLFYADDLPARDSDGYAAVQSMLGERADVRGEHDDADPFMRIESQRTFLDRILWPAVGSAGARAGLVCFNLPFDISRLAWTVGPTRNRSQQREDALAGGFSFALWGYERDGERREGRYRPRVAIKSLDSKRALKQFRRPARDDERDGYRGEFLDLRTLAFALTDRGHTLESACEAFGVPYTKRDVEHGVITRDYIEYCREDVQATQQLAERTLREFLRHPVPLAATRAFSPATIGKAYLKQMRVRPPRERQSFDDRVHGWAMSAYFGGRAECRIRKTPVPVVYCDFASMYPTVCALMGAWRLLASQRINAVDDTRGVQQLLDEIDLDAAFDPGRWPSLLGIARLSPDGDILPVRARYSGGQIPQIGVNPVTSSEPLWYTIADLVASKLLTGKTPRIDHALEFQAEGVAPLRDVELLGTVPARATEQDFFRLVVEQRRRAVNSEGKGSWQATGLKVLANATSYGIYAQMTRHEHRVGPPARITVHGRTDIPWSAKTQTPEDPGEYCFPPLAACITGAARLMLAMLERSVSDLGGTYAFCDTDSMAIVATETGDLIPCPGGSEHTANGTSAIRALSWDDVDAIRDRFTALNPYDRTLVPELLELETENYDGNTRRQLWCYGISAKRYALYTQTRGGEPELLAHSALDPTEVTAEDMPEPSLVKPSEHGLGHLLNPVDPGREDRDWIRQAWQHLIRGAHHLPTQPPEWLDQPAVGRTTVTSYPVFKDFHEVNAAKAYPDQIKPFNFLNTAFVDQLERPAHEQRMVLIAPYESDASSWFDADWTNRYSGTRYRSTIEPSGGYERPGIVTIKTYRDVLADYATHPEAKSLGPHGEPSERGLAGLMKRRPVRVAGIRHVGKESNRLEDVQSGLLQHADEIANSYDDYYTAVFLPTVVPKLRQLGIRETSRRTGISLGAVSAVLSGTARPRARQLAKYRALSETL
jgi:hypothetical protein